MQLINITVKYGRNHLRLRRHFISVYPKKAYTNNNEVEILPVEDNTHDAEMTIRSLRKVNLANRLVHVLDGEEALDFIFAKGKFSGSSPGNIPKVVLLDIKMPKVDGIEVLRQIKANEKTKMIPVVIMTSSREDQNMIMIASYRLGVNSYVVNPVDFEGFARVVSELGLYWLITNQLSTHA